MFRSSFFPLFFALILSGCYTTKMYFASEIPSSAKRSMTTHSLLWGLMPVGEVNLENLCGNGGKVSNVKTEVGPLGVAAQYLTLGVWTPMTVTATCSARDN